MNIFPMDFSHTDPKDFKDGYAASRLHAPLHYRTTISQNVTTAQHHRVIGEADVAKRQIFKIFKIRVRKKTILVRNNK